MQRGGKSARQGAFAAILAVACLAPCGQAIAATASGAFQVQATVVAACRVVPASLRQHALHPNAHYACLPAPELSRYMPPPPRLLPARGDVTVLTLEF
jgi:hypothetical protein